MAKNKKNIIIVIISLLVIAIFLIFIKTYYKKLNLGNTITIKSLTQVENHILNIRSYEARIEITIKSNKNENKYKLIQQYLSPNITKQKVLEPVSIAGLETVYNGKDLIINNTKLNLQTIYEDYNYITENQLYLNTFIENYKQNEASQIEEKGEIVILKTNTQNSNKYMTEQALFIDKQTNKPIKLEIQDINKNISVYILYTEIEINKEKKEDILAFKLEKIQSNI